LTQLKLSPEPVGMTTAEFGVTAGMMTSLVA
jgi:hypothetical protein